MKDILINMLTTLDSQIVFVAQVSADVCALKSVVSALGPACQKALEEQTAVERRKFQKVVESQQKLLEALKQRISRIPN
jgi:hypothetical protein